MNVYHIASQLNQNSHSKSTPFPSSIKLWSCYSFPGQCTIVEHCFDIYSLGKSIVPGKMKDKGCWSGRKVDGKIEKKKCGRWKSTVLDHKFEPKNENEVLESMGKRVLDSEPSKSTDIEKETKLGVVLMM
jgi:hypothetical protein